MTLWFLLSLLSFSFEHLLCVTVWMWNFPQRFMCSDVKLLQGGWSMGVLNPSVERAINEFVAKCVIRKLSLVGRGPSLRVYLCKIYLPPQALASSSLALLPGCGMSSWSLTILPLCHFCLGAS